MCIFGLCGIEIKLVIVAILHHTSEGALVALMKLNYE